MINAAAKIIMIDDDPIFSKLVEKRLGQKGITDIQIFDSAETGIASLKNRPDFVILDFSLPGMNGLDTLKKINKRHPDTEIVVLTSLGNEELSEECLENGASAFLSKGDDDSLNKIFSRIEDIAQKKKVRFRVRFVFAIIAIMLVLFLAWANLM